MAIVSWGYFNEVTPGNTSARVFTYAASNRFWCYNQDSVEVTPLIGGTREIQISTGEFGAFGIYNNNDSVATLQLPAPASAGTQWYLASATHTWADAASETTFELLHCGSVAQQPAGFVVDPGTKITQPLAYVPITFGQSDPGTPIDLRNCGTAGGSTSVSSEMGLSYLGYLGQEVWIGTTRYSRVLNAAGTGHYWLIDKGPYGRNDIAAASTSWGSSFSGWTTAALVSRAIRDGNTVELDLRIRKISGDLTVGSAGGVVDTPIFTVDTEWRPSNTVQAACSYINPGLGNSQGLVSLGTDGVIKFTAGTPNQDVKAMPVGSWSVQCNFTFIQTGA